MRPGGSVLRFEVVGPVSPMDEADSAAESFRSLE